MKLSFPSADTAKRILIVVAASALTLAIGGFVLTPPHGVAYAFGLSSGDATVERIPAGLATLRVAVYDSIYEKRWEEHWFVFPLVAQGAVQLNAFSHGEKTFLGLKVPVLPRRRKVKIAFDRDVSGTADGFVYEAQWTKPVPLVQNPSL